MLLWEIVKYENTHHYSFAVPSPVLDLSSGPLDPDPDPEPDPAPRENWQILSSLWTAEIEQRNKLIIFIKIKYIDDENVKNRFKEMY